MRRVPLVRRGQSTAVDRASRATVGSNRADAVLRLQAASGNAAVSRLLQRQAAPAPQPMTEPEAQKLSLLAKKAFDSGDYSRAIALWETVASEWALYHSPQILAELVYHIALAKARAGDINGAIVDVERYRLLGGADKAKGDQLAEEIHSQAEHAQAVDKPETSAQAEKVYREAEHAYEQGNYDRATALWRACAEWGSKHNPKVEAAAVYDIAIAKAWATDYAGSLTEAKRYHALPGRESARNEYLDDRIAEIRDQQEPPPKGVAKVRTAAGAERAFHEAQDAFDGGDYDRAVTLWQSVVDWATAEGTRIAPDILPKTLYPIALAKAHAGDARGAQTALDRYRTLPGAVASKAEHLAKRIAEIQTENKRQEELLHPKSADDAEKTYREAERVYRAGDEALAISLWQPVLDWAVRENKPSIAAAVVYDLAVANAHLGGFSVAEELAKRYASMPGAEPNRVAELTKRIQELRATGQ